MDIDEIDRALALRLLRLVRYRLEHPDYLTRNEYGTLLLDSFDRLRNELPLGYALFHLPWVLEWYKATRQYKRPASCWKHIFLKNRCKAYFSPYIGRDFPKCTGCFSFTVLLPVYRGDGHENSETLDKKLPSGDSGVRHGHDRRNRGQLLPWRFSCSTKPAAPWRPP